MKKRLSVAFGAAALILATQVAAQVTFYEAEGFRGRTFSVNKPVDNFARYGFNDRASSVVVERGRWEVCENDRFRGRCTLLKRGSYDSLRGMGLENRISSARQVNARQRFYTEAPPPMVTPVYEYRRRPNERTFEAPVTLVRAVMGPPEQRCWMEREQVARQGRGDANPGAVIAGALLGGILGHQIGGGRGKDIATVGGAVAGAAIGSNVGRNSGGMVDRDVRRCESVAIGPPDHWDVTYNFRGVDHRLQMNVAPGPTISVNRNGDPRQ